MSTSGAKSKSNRIRSSSLICVLEDGRRVKFSIKKRKRDPYYLVCFHGKDNRKKERSTKESNKRRAEDAGIVIIRELFRTRAVIGNSSWNESVEMMRRFMQAHNLRPGTIYQYELAVRNLKKVFPDTHGPNDITSMMAQTFKVIRLESGKSPRTVGGNIKNLRIVYGHWWRDVCRIVSSDPFAEVQPPKEDKRAPRIISPAEEQQFLTWLTNKWDNWRLPLVFLETKSFTGCRIGELANARTDDLRVGRLRFESETTKGRKQRAVKLPPSLYKELQSIAGNAFVFEVFAEQLRKTHLKRGNPHHARAVKEFAPVRLIYWLQRQANNYFKSNSSANKFKLHNFRSTAMSRARMSGVSYDDAAVAFACSPQTMRAHYINLDEQEITDRVMDTIQNGNGTGRGDRPNPRLRGASKGRKGRANKGRIEGDRQSARKKDSRRNDVSPLLPQCG